MKTNILAIFSILLIAGQMSAKEIVVEQPAFNVRVNNDFEIEKIIINDKSTTLKMKGYAFGLVNVDRDIYLNVGGKEYPLQHSENIEFGKMINWEQEFTLVFPPIPVKTERFDLCNRAKDWMIWDIELKKPKKNSKPSTAHIPTEFIKAANIKDDGKDLAVPQWKVADATLKGFFAGYKPEMDFCIEVIPDNIITGERGKSYFADVNPDGTFEIAVPMTITRQVNIYVVSGNKDKLTYTDRMRTRDFMSKILLMSILYCRPMRKHVSVSTCTLISGKMHTCGTTNKYPLKFTILSAQMQKSITNILMRISTVIPQKLTIPFVIP